MRAILFLSLFLIAFKATSQESVKSEKHDSIITTVHGKVLIANRGFAPVPAFSFDSPLVIGFLSIKKKWFSYEPDFAIGLNGKPWMANNWFRVTLPEQKKITLRASLNPSLFFKTERIDSTTEIVHAHRNFTFEFASTYRLSRKVSLIFTFMQIKAFDKGTLSGSFFDLSGSISLSQVYNFIKVSFRPELFYFDFDGNVDGLFTSATLQCELQKMPLSFYYQGVNPIVADFPGNTFKWNIGLLYSF